MENVYSIFQYSFIQKAFVAGSFVALLSSILGLFLVLRRLSLIGDGLAHASFGAIALGLFLGIYPFYISIPLVIVASLIILKLSEKARLYGDAAIGVVSSISIAIGIILTSISKGFNADLFSYLFGNILVIGDDEVLLSIILSLTVLLVIYLFYYDLFSITFNEELAKISGIKTKAINTLLVVLTAVTVVLSIRMVGIMLASAFLVLPAVTALQISKSFKSALLFSVISGVFSVIIGIIVSFIFNLPTGATIVLANFVLFILSFFLKNR